MTDRLAIELACGAVADAVFYHNSDRTHRDKLALALVELTRVLSSAVGSEADDAPKGSVNRCADGEG